MESAGRSLMELGAPSVVVRDAMQQYFGTAGLLDRWVGSQDDSLLLRPSAGHGTARPVAITCVNSGEAHDARDLYHAVLEYSEDGRWTGTTNPTS